MFINFGRAFKYVRASRRLSQLSETISYALPDLGWLSVIFLILFLGFLLALRLLVGHGVDGYADFIDGCFSLLELVLGEFGRLNSMFALQPTLMPIVFVIVVVILIFVMLTLILKTVDSAFVTVMDNQRYEKDRFVEELKEAAYLFVKECYQTVASPIQLYFMKRRVKGKLVTGGSTSEEAASILEQKRQALKAAKSKKVAPAPVEEEGEGGDGEDREGGGGAAAASSKTIELVKAKAGNKPKKGEPAEMSDMERLTDLKTRLSSGRFVKEEEVRSTDVIETVAYLTHRQGVLLRRLQALSNIVEQHEPMYAAVDDEDVDDDHPMGGGGMDPSEAPEVGTEFGARQLHYKGADVVAKTKPGKGDGGGFRGGGASGGGGGFGAPSVAWEE